MSIDPNGFRFVQQLVRDRAAIVLDEGKQYLVETRLSQLARRENYKSAQDVVDKLRMAPQGPLQRKVIEAMTTTETLWFRDVKPFDVLRSTILPDLIARRQNERALTIWSCACSSGQEPFSLGMLIREYFPQLANWHVQIIATDISTEMLARCRSGTYSELEVSRGLPVQMLNKYFKRDGTKWRISPEIHRLVQFRELNLASKFDTVATADVVMLRNVLIYFDIETKKQILGRIRQSMRKDAVLFLGTAETTNQLDDGFDIVRGDGTTYHRVRGV